MKNLMLTFISLILAGSLSAQVNFNNNTVSAENYSSALGETNISNGLSSFAGGFGSQATGNYSIGFGYLTLSNGLHSIALGSESKATQNYGLAMGRHAYSTNVNAVAIGKYAEAGGVSSFALGTNISNSAGFAFLVGTGAGFSEKLTNSIDNSLIIGFNSTVPTFYVGPSSGANYSGKIGIGNITAPTAKLHIKADDNENASLKLEPTGSDYEAQILLGDDVHTITAKPNDDFKFSIPSGRNFVFENGKIKTTGFQLTDGQQGEGKYLRSDADGNASWEASNVNSFECLASGLYSSAIGKWDTVTGDYSIGIGYRTNATGEASFATGTLVNSSGIRSMSFGHYLHAAATMSFVIGSGASYTGYLSNYTNNSLMIGFGSTKPTFFVGEATGSDETGKVGIGDVTEPQAKLHIKLDYGEFTALRLEPWSWTNDNYAEIQFGDEECSIRGTHAAGLKFYSPYKFVFHTGNVGIGVPFPLAKLQVNGDVFIEDENSGLILKSPDGQCWKITVNNSGELTTTSIDCNLTTGEANVPQPEKDVIRIYPNPAKNSINIENTYNYVVYATLRDIDGTLITTQKLQTGDNTLNIGNLATGTYIVTILNSQNEVLTSEKIMKM